MVAGMILAAGFGTRLLPLTENLPKALVPFCGKPMINHAIEKMRSFGVEKIVVNVHHHRKKMIDYLQKLNENGARIIISDEKEEHLLTGGGIKNARKFFGDATDIIVHNADVVSAIDYGKLTEFHKGKNSLVTLAIRKKNDERVLLFDDELNLTGWKNKTQNISRYRKKSLTHNEYGFTGVYVLSDKVFDFFPQEDKFEIMDFFLNPEFDFPIKGFLDESDYWFDLGSVEKIKKAERFFGCDAK